MRPRRFDCFPFAGSDTELLLLECRLTELYDVFDKFVIVEANVDHQDHPKPYNYEANADRFAQWADKIHYVKADNLPIVAANAGRVLVFDEDGAPIAPDKIDDGSWAREHAQREWIAKGLEELDASDDDIVFQSDADEIPSVLAARNLKPNRNEMISLHQRGHFWAIDWLYPMNVGWFGTVAARWGAIKSLAEGRESGPLVAMRNTRNVNRNVPGGWHFSWLGGTKEAWLKKVHSFCHPEVEQRIVDNADKYYFDGWHVDGEKMQPVEVDHSWPKWMQVRENVPDSWYRPRAPRSIR